jgi:hypothetical protein
MITRQGLIQIPFLMPGGPTIGIAFGGTRIEFDFSSKVADGAVQIAFAESSDPAISLVIGDARVEFERLIEISIRCKRLLSSTKPTCD